ncbi:MAG: hypothetical protein ACRD68_10115, partial [Pyrinomonadaceae bacterium]
VEVEELQTLTEEKWENEVPSDARVISRNRQFHHNDKVQTGTRSVQQTYTERVQTGTRRVKTGTRNKGNGYFEDVYSNEPVYSNRTKTRTVQEPVYRDVPVYRDKVKYQIDRWRTVATERTEGADNAPRWPEVSAGPKRREGKRVEKYVVRLRDPRDGDTYEREVEAGVFTRFVPGSNCLAKINRLGVISTLDPPGR